jgi:superfamily I DNA and/or RNA helicase
MNQEIQSLSNKIVYNDALECANDFVKFRRLEIDITKM